MGLASSRTNLQRKIARDAGLYCRDVLVLSSGERKPIGTPYEFDEAFKLDRANVAKIEFHVPCLADDYGADLNLNMAERILRGICTAEQAQQFYKTENR